MSDQIKMNVAFRDALSSAERGGVSLSEAEYRGFADIGTGGVLSGASAKTTGLRLADDTDGSLDGYDMCDPLSIVREAPLSSQCLRRDEDGGVQVNVGKTEESTEIQYER